MNEKRFDRLEKLFEDNDLETIKREFTKEEICYSCNHFDLLDKIIYHKNCKECIDYILSICNDKTKISLEAFIGFHDDINYIDYIIDKFNFNRDDMIEYITDSSYSNMYDICDGDKKLVHILKKHIWKEI